MRLFKPTKKHSEYQQVQLQAKTFIPTASIKKENKKANTSEKMTTPSIAVTPLVFPEDSGINFGASVSNIDIEKLTGKST